MNCNFSVSSVATSNSRVFQIEISEWDLEQLKYHKFLGIRFPKNRYAFASDLTELLTGEIQKHLLELMEK